MFLVDSNTGIVGSTLLMLAAFPVVGWAAFRRITGRGGPDGSVWSPMQGWIGPVCAAVSIVGYLLAAAVIEDWGSIFGFTLPAFLAGIFSSAIMYGMTGGEEGGPGRGRGATLRLALVLSYSFALGFLLRTATR